MDAIAVIVSFALFIAVLYLVVRPFLVPPEAVPEEYVSPELESQKNRIIDAIREIEMDYQTGKLSEEDYTLLKSRYTAAAAEVMRRIDAESESEEVSNAETEEVSVSGASLAETKSLSVSAPDAPDTSSGDATDVDEDDELEREIAERKAKLKEAQDA